jgi:hypothetical protein
MVKVFDILQDQPINIKENLGKLWKQPLIVENFRDLLNKGNVKKVLKVGGVGLPFYTYSKHFVSKKTFCLFNLLPKCHDLFLNNEQ